MRGLIAVFVTIIGGLFITAGLVPVSAGPPDDNKVFVCKYVGTPGVNERLKDGKNPIDVAISSIQNNQWDGVTVPAWFSDAHDRSYVLEYNTGQDVPSVDKCPDGDITDYDLAEASIFVTPATCETPETADVDSVSYASLTSDSGTTGPGTATFTFLANKDALFDDPEAIEDDKKLVITQELSGQLTGEECVHLLALTTP